VPDCLELSFDLGALDAQAAEEACLACGASAVTFMDAHDDPVLEPLPGEFRLWRQTRLKSLFAWREEPALLIAQLAAALGIAAADISVARLAERAWEREWLKDFHAQRFGRRLWVCPHHETVSEPDAVVVRLDPGLAFGTGTHPSTALCLAWLDAHLIAGWRVIDYGCGSGVLSLAAGALGARAVHAFDIDPQALIATSENAARNALAQRIRVHADADTLPAGVDLLCANILSGVLCALVERFARLVREGGGLLLAGLLEHEAADVTAAYASCFDVTPCGARDGWVALAGRRR
jgi:ribosomal protein L11 methyltransferase